MVKFEVVGFDRCPGWLHELFEFAIEQDLEGVRVTMEEGKVRIGFEVKNEEQRQVTIEKASSILERVLKGEPERVLVGDSVFVGEDFG